MAILNADKFTSKNEISGIEITTDCLTGRAGLALVMRFAEQTGLLDEIAGKLAQFRTHTKGIDPKDVVKQVFAFFMDGTSRNLTQFDRLKDDPGYQGILETSVDDMASSHQIKRFFANFPKTLATSFRKLLRMLFAHRLKLEKPEVLALFLDTMVLDNDDAQKRQGCEPT